MGYNRPNFFIYLIPNFLGFQFNTKSNPHHSLKFETHANRYPVAKPNCCSISRWRPDVDQSRKWRCRSDGFYLLTNGMDDKLCTWDMRPYAPQNRCVKILEGHQHNFEKNLLKCSWSPDGSKVTTGSSDRMVYIWDTTSRRILYKLPGHTGSVIEVVFHQKERTVGSCSSNKQIYIGEL